MLGDGRLQHVNLMLYCKRKEIVRCMQIETLREGKNERRDREGEKGEKERTEKGIKKRERPRGERREERERRKDEGVNRLGINRETLNGGKKSIECKN